MVIEMMLAGGKHVERLLMPVYELKSVHKAGRGTLSFQQAILAITTLQYTMIRSSEVIRCRQA